MRQLLHLPALVGLGLLALFAQGCDGRATERWRVHERFIEEPPTQRFERATLEHGAPIEAWSFDGSSGEAAWSLGQQTRLRETSPGAHVQAAETAALRARVDLDTSSIGAFELTLGDVEDDLLLFLEWAGRDEPFSPDRSAKARVSDARGAGGRAFFELSRHESWTGHVERLRVRLRSVPRGRPVEVSLLGLVALAPPSPPGLDLPWQVTLDGDTRNALLTTTGATHERRVDLPRGARLRFAYGAESIPDTPIHIRVVAVEEDGDRTVLFSERLATAEQSNRWHHATVDLADWGDRPLRLRLEQTDEPESTIDTTVFWAHPEILRSDSDPLPPDVLLVSIDTLRADRLSLYGNPRPTSPHLDAWASRSAVVFEQAVVQAPWTLPSHASMLSGLNAQRHGVNHEGAVPTSVELLAERLRKEGYTTVAVTGGAYLHPRYGLSQGFDRWVFWSGWGNPSQPDGELEHGLATALATLREEHAGPLLLFFHTYEVHAPYTPRQPYLSSFGRTGDPPRVSPQSVTPTVDDGFMLVKRLALDGGGQGQNAGGQPKSSGREDPDEASSMAPSELAAVAVDLYDSAIAYTDSRLIELVQSFESARPDSMIVITSDHGENLGEHGVAAHSCLFEPTLLVPLIIRAPNGHGAGRRVARQVRSIDIVPTILELTGLPPATDVDGVSLAGLMSDSSNRTSHPEEAWSYATSTNFGLSLRLSGRQKYIFNATAWNTVKQREQLFELDLDPGELNDLSHESDTTELLARAMAQLHQAPGLRMRAVNRGRSEVSALLSGSPITPYQVELISDPCGCLEWHDESEARLTLEPGTSNTLLFENPGASRMSLHVSRGSDPSFETSLDLLELGTSAAILAWEAGTGWHWIRRANDDSEASDPPVSFTFQWLGAHPEAGGQAVTDPDLIEQLRALGYL